MSTDTIHVTPEEIVRFVTELLVAEGVPENDAATVAECLVEADLRGVDTHGVVRLPGYIDRVHQGLINPRPDMKFEQVAPVAASLDGENGFGFVIARRAMDAAIDMAEGSGVGLVSVRRSTHFGMAASYILQAMRRGMAAIVFSNASQALPPWGGRQEMFGTNPLAFGVPVGKEGDFLLDMSPCVAARGKIRRALRQGVEIPLGYALDSDGQPTTDPAKALEGVLLPIGGYKGSGLSIMVDIMAGVLSGAAYGGDVRNQYQDFENPQNVGHFMLAFKADLFLPMDQIHDRMDTLTQRVRSAPKAEGFDEILMAGEPERRREEAHRASGIPYSLKDLEPLLTRAEKHGLAPLAARNT